MLRSPLRTHVLAAGLVAFLSGIGLQSQAPPRILPADPLLVAGSGPGAGQVAISKSDGTPVIAVSPFGAGFTGGVRVAAGDINGDGVTDVVATMAGHGGQVRAFSGSDGSSLGPVTPFGPGVSGGVFVALGDVNADGHDDILLGAGSGGLAQLIDGATRTVLGTGRPFPLPYNAGVTVALGDLNSDGRADLIFGTTLGGFVRVLDFPSLAPIASGFPYGPLFSGGVNIAAGDVNGDGVDEVAVAPRNAGGPVRIYTVHAELVIDGTPFGGVQGVSLTMGDLNGDGRDDLVMGAGAGATPHVRAFSILDRTQLFDHVVFDAGFRGGVWVATPRAASTRFTSAATTVFAAGAAGTFAVTTQHGSDAALSVGGSLPSGVTFTDHGDGTATLAGTPAAGTGGSYALTLVATRNGQQVAQQPFTLVVQEPAAIASASAVTFASGSANTFTVITTGAPAATITATGLVPAGVTFTNNGNGTATLAGSPTPGSEGTYPLTLSASNGLGAPATQAFTLTVVAGGAPLFTSAGATTFTVGAVGSFSVLTSATPVAGTITLMGALPAGVTFTNHGNGTATLSGMPDAGTAGAYPLLFTADNGVASTPQNFTLTVDPVAGGAPSFISGNTVTFAVATADDFTVTTTGSPVAPTLTSSGALPSGITFTNNGDGTATLGGTAAAGTAGSYPLTFTADNGVGTATQLFTLTVNNVSASPTFTSGTTTAFVIGTSETFAITTAASPAVTGITIAGALPTGVTFTDNGDGTASLAGTPQAGTAGPYALTFMATNGGAPVDQAFTLSVQETAAITSASASAFTVGIADSFTVTTAGLPVPTIALTTGALPTGVTYTDNGDGTATIAGTAAAGTVGAYPVTLTATNGVGTPGTQAFTLNVVQNTPPTLDVIPDPLAILEDAAQQTITLSGISAGAGDSQPLAVTASSSDPAVVPNPTVTYTTPNATGALLYTPVADASGSAVFTVTVTDGGLDNDLGTPGDNGVFSRTVTVAVTSVNDPPVAQNKSFSAQANMAIVGLSGLLTGVTDADAGVNGCTPSFSVAGVSATSPAGGNTTNLDTVNGTFDFNPPPGITGNVTFTYTVQDTGCPGTATSAPATVTVDVGGPVIWFVDDSAAGGGDGRLTNPFNALSSADAVDAAGHVIFLYSGSHPAGITLHAGESLMGQGAIAGSFDLLMGISPPAGTVARPAIGGTRPSISVTSGTAVTLASGNVVHGLNVSNTNGSGIVGSAVGTLALANFDVAVTGGSALSLTTSGTVTGAGTNNNLTSTNGTALNVQNVTIGASGVSFRSVSANGGTNGILLNDTGSSGRLTVAGNGGACSTALNCTGGAIQNTAGIGVLLTNTRNVSLTRVYIGNTGSHGVSGTGMADVTGGAQPTFEIRNSLLDSPGDGDNESALYFDTLAATNITGRLLVADTTIQNFEDVGIHVGNVSGTLTIDVTDVLINNNSDTNGEEGIDVEANGTANITLNVTGTRTGNTSTTMFTDLEGGGINAIVQNSGVLDVNLTGLVDRGTGGPDNFPTPPAWTFAADGSSSTFTFDISDNSIVDASGDGLFIGHEGTIMGRITNNVISGMATGDAIRIDTDTASTTTATILIQDNNFGNDVTFPGIGGDGIQVLHRDGTKTLNLTIEGNQIKNTNSEGIRYFADDDILGGGPGNAVRIATNAFGSNGLVDLSDSIVMISQDPGTDVCTSITANTSVEGITLQQTLSATLQITQADTAALAAANSGALVTANGTVTFNGTCSNPPLPTNP